MNSVYVSITVFDLAGEKPAEQCSSLSCTPGEIEMLRQIIELIKQRGRRERRKRGKKAT